MVYAATGFVILELVSIIAEPLGLPDGTLRFVFIMLCIGFVISLVLSWFYDFTQDGLERLKPARQTIETPPETPSRLIAWKIATYSSVVIIIGLLAFNLVGRNKQTEAPTILEKSIAVLPFKYISDEYEKQYLADGAMDDILLHLSKIGDLRVMSRTSVEQYRESAKTATVICQELDVAYLLEGSFQKYGDQVRLIVQLITPGKEGHIWANEYNRNWKDIFSVQSEVAQTIARELQAVITPQEKQLIEKIPTSSLTAYDFYQRGREEYLNLLDNIQYTISGTFFRGEDLSDIMESMEKSQGLYYRALEYDSSFAKAYTGLAWLYRHKHYWDTYFSENFLDSVLILADIAISYDNQLAEAYTVKGEYYRLKGMTTQAIKAYDKAIKFNPNDWMSYNGKAMVYEIDDLVKAIENYHKAVSLYHGSELPGLLRSMSSTYEFAGFKEIAKYYLIEALKLDDDSVAYYENLGFSEEINRKIKRTGNLEFEQPCRNRIYILATWKKRKGGILFQ
jgi:TolB-like protein